MNSPLRFAVAIAALASLFVPAIPASAGARTVTDAAGRTVEIADTSRIVAIGGAVTEIVYALGFGDRVVAIDLTSGYPPAAKEKPSIGYMRALAPEGVLSLAPTLVLAIEGSGPPDAIEVLTGASVPFVLVPDAHDEAGVLRKVRFVAEALGVPERGEEMARRIAEDFAALAKIRETIKKPRKAIFVLAIGGGTPTAGGAGSSADGIFALAGVPNALHDMKGYKPVTAEASLAAAPDVVVTMIERNHGLDADAMFALPAFKGTPAAANKSLLSISSYYLSFGPRTAHAARDLAAKVYPELSIPPLPERPWTTAQTAAKK